jgi:serine/threonine protein kinase
MLCATCRGDLSRLLHQLLGHARQGEAPLATLAGYTLLKELGRGGMGAVYLARRDEQDQPVALKLMLPQGAASERATAQFLREIEQMKRLQHPHIVQLYEAGYAAGIYFFTLEYCAGGSLRGRLSERGGPLPVEEAVGLILQALAGLHYAHTLDQNASPQATGQAGAGPGLVHRDIKPANLFLSGTSQAPLVKVGDFGLAKAFDLAGLSGLTRSGAIMGTPAYMPRQLAINFKYAQPAVDVWAMAASLYHLLTGTVPRDFAPGRDPWLVVLQSQAVPIRQRRATIPKRLAEVIDHALEDQPEIGFKTVATFKQALEGALS